jgi:mRNA-degrading endonuclease toxin of MazEF toxin-antitoxin module
VDTFRLKLKEYLDERGLSVYALIKASGLAPNTLYAIARGASGNARLDTLAGVLTGLRRLTGEDATLSDILDEDALATGTSKVRAAPEKPESAPDDSEWLQAFLAAAKGQSARENTLRYHHGSVVLVQLDRQQVKPCVIVSDEAATRKAQIYGIVPLGPPLAHPVGGLTPSLKKPGAGLPTSSTALCTEVQTVQPAQIVGFVGRLDARHLKSIKTSLSKLFALGPVPDGRNTR